MTAKETIIFVACMLAVFGPLTWWLVAEAEPRRDERLERQLATIREARSIDDLRGLLEEIVRRQRNDYR